MKQPREAPARPKPTRAQGAHIPADYGAPEVAAIQALIAGEADAYQQQLAMRWIIERASGVYEFQFYPTDRDTSFALGRAHVGQQIIKLSKLNAMSLRRDQE
jgi:hypothetical protein